MCYSPVKILNPSRTYSNDTPMYLYVPCGHCPDCQRNMHNDWFFRCLVEYNHYKDNGGAVYFITLTYSDDALPILTLPDGTKVSCFCKRHIHNFIKYFRILLKKEGYEWKGMKYLICCEYSDKNTKRPHYHGLLYLPFHIPCEGKNSLFNRLLRTAWKHGWIVCSKFGWEVTSAAGIRYASKYVCKEFGFYRGAIADYLFKCDKEERKERRSLINDCLPHHWQSVGFGESFIDIIKTQPNVPQFLVDNYFSLRLGQNDIYKIPRYYHLKLEKKVNKLVSEMLGKVYQSPTELGRKVLELKCAQRIPNDITTLRKFRDSLDENFPCYEYVKEAFDYVHSNTLFDDRAVRANLVDNADDYNWFRNFIIDYLSKTFARIDFERLSAYRCYLRFLPLYRNQTVDDSIWDIVPEVINAIVNPSSLSPDFVEIGLYNEEKDVIAEPFAERDNLDSYLCYENHYFFEYEQVSHYLDVITALQSLCREYAYLLKQSKKKKCREDHPNIPEYYSSF